MSVQTISYVKATPQSKRANALNPPMEGDQQGKLARQIKRIDVCLQPMRQRSNQFSWLRVAIFLGGIVACAALLWLANPWLFVSMLLAALGVLLYVVHRHNQLDRTIRDFETLQQIKREQIARATLNWRAIPAAASLSTPVDQTLAGDHPFAADLDLSGEFSLHRLLDCAASAGGSQRLFDWLITTIPNAADIAQRQQIVRELIPLRLWRDRLLLNARSATTNNGQSSSEKGSLGEVNRGNVAIDELLTWLAQQRATSLMPGLLLSFLLLGMTVLLGLFAWLGWIGGWWQLSYLAYFALQLSWGRSTSGAFTQASTIQNGLERLLAIMEQVESFHYRNTPSLRSFCDPILDEALRPSHLLRQVRRIVAATGIQGNPVVAFVCNALFPWNLYFAHRLQAATHDLAQHLPQWLETWYGLEAFNSLATYAWLHPQHSFPTVLAADAPFTLQCQHLGHPLIPGAAKVRNDFTLEHLGDLALITGSNMAGKSTFLRTLGLNLLLAFAGSVIDGAGLQASPLRLFTSIKISDSVTEGVSFFYAEVKRLKRLLDELEATETLPLFFCIDEIFRGTNNRERLIGSRSYIRQLVGKHGVGLISTHDLELVKLAESLPQITNYHFRDDIIAGEMVFDYKLHLGPCPTTNALTVMRNAGLPVEDIATDK